MPRSASLRNYFELLPRDLTGDYIHQVLCSQSKGAKGNEVCLHLFCKNEWSVDQRRRRQQNGVGSKNAEFHFRTSDDRVIGSQRVNPIHDFSVADPFAKIVRFRTRLRSGDISLNLSDIHVQLTSASVCS